MQAKWINLYGVHPEERSPKTKSLREGTCFLGRVLIALNLSPNEYPNLGFSSSGPLNEPKNSNYHLWVDLYEWLDCEYANQKTNLFVQVTIGSEKSLAVKAKRNKKNG